MNREYRYDLTQGNIFLQLLSFFGPMFFANLLQMVYNLADMAIVGQFVGSNGLAAVSVSTTAITVLTFLAFGISNGGQIVVAQYTGAGQHDKTQALIGPFFSFVLLTSLALTALSVLFCTPILHFANVPAEAWDDGVAYFVTCSCGSVFTYEYNAISAVFRGLGDSRRPLLFILVATVLNIVLDLVFIAVLHLGTFGAALATVLAQSTGAGKHDRILKTVGASGVLSVGIVSVIVLLMLLFPRAVYSVFTADSAVLDMVPLYNPVGILLVYGSAFRAPANGLVSGTGNGTMNLILAVADGLIGHLLLPVLLGFVLGMGLIGLWYGYAIAGYTACFVGIIYIASGAWKRGKNMAER